MSLSRGFPSVQFSNAKLFGLPPLLWEMSGPSSSTPAPTTGSRYFRASTTTGIATKKKSTNKTGGSARGIREREEASEADNNKALGLHNKARALKPELNGSTSSTPT
ncbi:hypothetical protein JB92DRAFT_2832748 [Gautieria morchelliformis]|nr:hypothetical protein JB92DRAFT_2832748 [Gautieria morchelliformis]